MSISSQPATLERFIRTFRLQETSRSEIEWWALIVLKDSTFEFHLVVFRADGPDDNGGTSSLFGWHEDGNLGLRRQEYTSRPQLDADGLAIPCLRVGGLPFKQLSASMIEAFLDDWHRSKILNALKDEDQRRSVLPWSQKNGLAVYRQLEKQGRGALEIAVFPPKLDFLDEDEDE